MSVGVCACLQGGVTALVGTDAQDVLQWKHEDLAVTDLAGARSGFDRFDDPVDDRVVDGGLDLHLGQEVDDVLGATYDLSSVAGNGVTIAGAVVGASKKAWYGDINKTRFIVTLSKSL